MPNLVRALISRSLEACRRSLIALMRYLRLSKMPIREEDRGLRDESQGTHRHGGMGGTVLTLHHVSHQLLGITSNIEKLDIPFETLAIFARLSAQTFVHFQYEVLEVWVCGKSYCVVIFLDQSQCEREVWLNIT
jgi:hypothetical protein